MYPGEILNLFPPFPRTEMVFVAMSFSEEFFPRWEDVIFPAISNMIIENNKNLVAHRVDLEQKNDALIAEIVKNISECRLFLADISTTGYLPINSEKSKPIRNANVLYEVGIAHACRLPEEVILLRSDNDPLDFDIAGVRVHRYDPTNTEEAVNVIQNLIIHSINAIDNKKHIAVEKALQMLDVKMYFLLQAAMTELQHPSMRTMRDVMSNLENVAAINRMLNLGLIETKFKELTLKPDATTPSDIPYDEMISYTCTPLGLNVLLKAHEKTKFIEALTKFKEGNNLI